MKSYILRNGAAVWSLRDLDYWFLDALDSLAYTLAGQAGGLEAEVLVSEAWAKFSAGRISDHKPELLKAALRYLRLYGFAVVYYGGDALHKAVGAPTAGKSWRDSLMEAAAGLARSPAQAAARLPGDTEITLRHSESISGSLFDLNAAGDGGVTVAKAISDGSCKV